MSTQKLELLAPSGAEMTLDLPAGPRVNSVAAQVRFAGGAYGRAFAIGPRGYHNFAVNHLIDGTPQSSLSVQGRELAIGTSKDGLTTVASLLGDYHELQTVFSGPAPDASTIKALFSSLHVKDSVPGMVVRPKRSTLLDQSLETFAVTVAERGQMSIPGPREAKNLQPRGRGRATRHGEIWRAALPGRTGTRHTDFSYTLGFASGMLTSVFHEGDQTQEQAMTWMDGLNLSWSA